MTKMTQEEVNEAIRLHGLWVKGETTGERADLSNEDLSGLDLSGANLRCANLRGTDLRGTDLSGAQGYLR